MSTWLNVRIQRKVTAKTVLAKPETESSKWNTKHFSFVCNYLCSFTQPANILLTPPLSLVVTAMPTVT